MWCVVVCDLENLKNEEAMTRVGSQGHRKKDFSYSYKGKPRLDWHVGVYSFVIMTP